jgi:hypothetical protein
MSCVSIHTKSVYYWDRQYAHHCVYNLVDKWWWFYCTESVTIDTIDSYIVGSSYDMNILITYPGSSEVVTVWIVSIVWCKILLLSLILHCMYMYIYDIEHSEISLQPLSQEDHGTIDLKSSINLNSTVTAKYTASKVIQCSTCSFKFMYT